MPRAPLCVLVSLAACSAPAPAPHTDPEVPAKPMPRVPIASKKADPAELKARVAATQARLAESRAIADAYAAGTLGDRLASGQLVLVDARAPRDTRQVQYYLITGARTPPPATVADLDNGGASPHNLLLGGEDSTRPALFREITRPGTYTACAALGPVVTAAEKAEHERMEAELRAELGDKPDPARFKAALEKLQTRGESADDRRTRWQSVPLRCKTFEITADPASRIVVLAG